MFHTPYTRQRLSFCVGLIALGTLISAAAAQPAGSNTAQPAGNTAQPPADTAEEISQIRQAAETYIAALRLGDSARLQSLWTPSGDVVDTHGHVTKGRELVRLTGKTPVPAARAITTGDIRLVTADVAIEDGTVELSVPGQAEPAVARYSAIWVKRNGQWLLDGVRESLAHGNSHRDRLRSLGWLVGDWEAEGSSGRIELSCHWSPDGNYLLREMKVQPPQGPALSVSQRIGWDAAKQRITAWSFDSEGGHGTSAWSRRDGGWLISASGVLPEGQTTSSTNTITRLSNDAFAWETTQSVSAGAPQPDRKLEFARRRATTESGGSTTK